MALDEQLPRPTDAELEILAVQMCIRDSLSTAVMESNFDWTIVKVETDDQITGYGEAFLGPGLTAVIREFGEILQGEDPTAIDRVLRRMRASCVHASPGLVFHAISGIETALLDAIGKRYKLPIWQILGLSLIHI